MPNTPDYTINYEDERFQNIEADKEKAQAELDNTYGGMINTSDKYYEDQKQFTQDWADKQTQLQQEQTDFAIEKIEQQKDQAHKDYLKEQSGAYVDWRKQSNQYGTEAEKMASAGLANTGFSESSQVGMYNTYQMRVATARESYNNAVLNYNNAIKDAMLQNNAALAEIAAKALEKQLELSLQGFQYKNTLILEQANKKIELDNMYYNRYQDVLQQMNTENALAEDIRQYNETQKWNTEQKELDRQHDLARDEINRKFEADQAELNRKHDFDLLNAKTEKEKELLEEQHKKDMEKLAQQHKNDLELLAKQKSYSSSGGGSSGGGGKVVASSTSSDYAKVSGNSGAKVDTSNIISLGFGPISASRLYELVKQGKVIQYTQNGVIKFRLPTQTVKPASVSALTTTKKPTITTAKKSSTAQLPSAWNHKSKWDNILKK